MRVQVSKCTVCCLSSTRHCLQGVWGAFFFLRIIACSLLPWLFSPPVLALAGETTMSYSVMYERFKWETDLILRSNSSRRAAIKARLAKALLENDL